MVRYLKKAGTEAVSQLRSLVALLCKVLNSTTKVCRNSMKSLHKSRPCHSCYPPEAACACAQSGSTQEGFHDLP
ncbi:hypothetical protein BDV10DRAFT_179865 [Aspergillus recurvatus]